MQVLTGNPEIEHGTVKVVFVPDEEIGLLGAKALDVASLNADFAYTLDCCAVGEIVYENWNAGEFRLTFKGQPAHPMSAKGKLRNAILYAQQFIAMMPGGERPEYTEGTEGYYWAKGIQGSVAETTLVIDIRDFTKDGYEARRASLKTSPQASTSSMARVRFTWTTRPSTATQPRACKAKIVIRSRWRWTP